MKLNGMPRVVILPLLTALILITAACGGDNSDEATQPLPTRFELPTLDATQELTAEVAVIEVTAEITTIVETTEEPSTEAAPPTNTPQSTVTARPTATFVPTIPATATTTTDAPQAAAASATAAVIEAPVFSTLTPIPAGAGGTPAPTQEPLLAADVVITTQQFQEELDVALADIPAIDSAIANFVAESDGQPQGINIRMVASGGEALTTGDVFIAFELSGDFVQIGVTAINVGSGAPPQAYTDLAINELRVSVINAFSSILAQRLGENHNLQSLTITATNMDIMLLVPES